MPLLQRRKRRRGPHFRPIDLVIWDTRLINIGLNVKPLSWRDSCLPSLREEWPEGAAERGAAGGPHVGQVQGRADQDERLIGFHAIRRSTTINFNY